MLQGKKKSKTKEGVASEEEEEGDGLRCNAAPQ
jgi:hypothetical protein